VATKKYHAIMPENVERATSAVVLPSHTIF